MELLQPSCGLCSPIPGAATLNGGRLTPLGRLLATLPVDVRVGKMLVYAAMLGCLDPVGVNKCGLCRWCAVVYCHPKP